MSTEGININISTLIKSIDISINSLVLHLAMQSIDCFYHNLLNL